MKKSFISYVLVLLIATMASQASALDEFSHHLLDDEAKFRKGNYEYGTNPGVMIRIEEITINRLKYALQQFLPHFVSTDMNLPHMIEFDVGYGDVLWNLLTAHVSWSDITYKDAILDVLGIRIDFFGEEGYVGQKVHVDFPFIKEWGISAYQEVENDLVGWFTSGQVDLELNNIDMNAVFVFNITQEGYIHPDFSSVSMTFGNSYFAFENWFLEFIGWQTIEYALVMIENSIYFFGHYIINDMLSPNLDRLAMYYQVPWTMRKPVDEDTIEYANMIWDLRSTQTPMIEMGFMDFFIMGELRQADNFHTHCPWDPKYMTFSDPLGDERTYSQVVFSENMVSCSLNAMSSSTLGEMSFDSAKLNKMFEMFPNLSQFKMDTSTVAQFIPIFEQKSGVNIPMITYVNFKDIDVKFGEYDTDVIITYTANLSFRKDEGQPGQEPILLEDELRLITSGSIRQDDNVLYMKVLSHKLDHSSSGDHDYPIKDNLGINNSQYREFVSSLGFYLNKQKDWLNENVLNNGNGLHMPMGSEEIQFNMAFRDASFHIFVEVMPNAADFLETEYWDKDYKEERNVKEHDDADWDWLDGETWEEEDAEWDAWSSDNKH